MAEWLCSGLQLRVRRFDSDSSLHPSLLRLRSDTEISRRHFEPIEIKLFLIRILDLKTVLYIDARNSRLNFLIQPVIPTVLDVEGG